MSRSAYRRVPSRAVACRRVSPLDSGGRIRSIFTAALFVDIRLRLLEKAAELRDRGQIVRAQQLVDVANRLRKRAEPIEEHGAEPRPGSRRQPTGSSSREHWAGLKRGAGDTSASGRS